MDPDGDASRIQNGLEMEQDSSISDGGDRGNGVVELQPLVSSGRYHAPTSEHHSSGPQDAPEDVTTTATNVAYNKTHAAAAAANGTSPAIEHVSSALSNEGIKQSFQTLFLFGQQAYAAAQDRVSSYRNNNAAQPATASNNSNGTSSTAPSAPPSAPPTPTADYSDAAATKQKKMVLLLLITLFVALMGASLSKYTALEVEEELEEGETEVVIHEDIEAEAKEAAAAEKSKIHIINVEGYQPTEMVNVTDYLLPGTEKFPALSTAKGRPYYPTLNHFQHRDPTSPYAQQWGYFDFQDPNSEWDGKMRPQPSNFHEVPNRDVKNTDFPTDSWQVDDEYMKAFLTQAKLLVNRSMEAVYAEYGVGLSQDGSIELSDEDMINREKFFPFTLKETLSSAAPGSNSWSTKQSFDGNARRIIHHIMTGDTFKLVLGGHSAAAGHGAGFNQSYIIEAGHVLEPVFAHLGVDFRAYNFAQGGMGTLQQALAGMDLRNKEADWVYWDSAMTERPGYIINFFFRQALIAGNRAPVLMGDGQMSQFHGIGAGVAKEMNGWVPSTVSGQQVKTMPWAAQWLQCTRSSTTDCKAHEYTAGCWVKRENDWNPRKPQGGIVGGQASWHPGNRIHKRRGRMIAMVILKSLEYALNKWEELGAESGFPIAEEHWHVTDYYKNIREKAVTAPGCWGNTWRIGQKRHLLEDDELDEDNHHIGHRHLDDTDFWPARLCNVPMQGRSNWGPRHNPMETSLLSIMRPNKYGHIEPGFIDEKSLGYYRKPCYDPPDLPAHWTVPPVTEPFAPLIGASRRLVVEEQNQRQLRGLEEGHEGDSSKVKNQVTPTNLRVLAEGDDADTDNKDEAATEAEAAPENKITVGLGHNVKWGRIGVCDGTSHHWCDKPCDNGCLMGGAQDARGMVCFDGLSGWLVFDIKNVKHGFIGARMEPWHNAKETPTTSGWSDENNGGNGNYGKRGRELEEHLEYMEQQRQEGIERMKQEIEEDIHTEDDPTRRRLGGGQSCGLAGSYTFEWAINGKIVSWNKGEFCNHFTRLNYNLDVMKFMDDESQTGDFELAMRMTDVGRGNAMCISHLYWA